MKQLFRALTDRDKTASDEPLLASYRHNGPGRITKAALYVLLPLASVIYGYYFFVTFPYMVVPLSVPLALVVGLMIWALPQGEYVPTSVLKPLLFAFTAALFLWPNYLAIAIPGLPWLTLLRILGLPTTLFLLVCASTSPALRGRIRDVLSVQPLAFKLLLAFIAVQIISIAFSADTSGSISKFTLAQTNWTAMFFLACYVFSVAGAAQAWLWTVWAIALVLCAIGIWEYRLGQIPWAGHIPSFLQVEDPTVKRILAGATRTAIGLYRVSSTTTHPLNFAEFLGLTMPLPIHFAMQRYPIYARLAAAASIPLILYVVFLTDSRLGLGACLLSPVLYVFFWAMSKWRKDRNGLVGPAIALSYPLIFAAFLAATVLIGRLRAEVWGNGSTQASTESRGDQWASGLAKLPGHPLGHGIGQGGQALGFTNADGILTIDTYYLSLLLEYGYLGFIVYFALFLSVIWTGGNAGISRHAKGETLLLIPLTISLLNFVMIKSVLSAEANHPFVFIMLGAILALAWRVSIAERQATMAEPDRAVQPIAANKPLSSAR